MKLTRFQRDSIFAGNAPPLIGDGPCPATVGQVVHVSKKVSLTVDGIARPSPTRWKLHYTISDRRDPIRQIRRTPPVAHFGASYFDDHGYPLRIPEGEASEESSYTPGGKSAIADAGEAVSADEQKRQTERAHKGFARAKDADLKERLGALADAEDQIAMLQAEARRQGVDVRQESKLARELIARGRSPQVQVANMARKVRGRWAA